ncbi:hypothetical protein FWK35_00012601 [Aphis craccivora]|uniref:Uncharacterized protein n=1 Tax=Aphis craccivora TaxID=307492 RepID=A0A6G0ZCL1_APHCR|nr:hypothetical protein FWK35_00012601 [Aphis craccivora]
MACTKTRLQCTDRAHDAHFATKQQQERLSELVILATEAKEAEKMDIKELIRQFADLKARKKRFTS